MADLREALRQLLNSVRAEKEYGSGTPDFVLAQYLLDCLKALDAAVRERERWYGRWYGRSARSGETSRGGARQGRRRTTRPSRETSVESDA